MATSQLYSLLYVKANAALLMEHGSASVKRSNNAQLVKTVGKGFAGLSPGAAMAEIDVTNAMPSADLEIDMGPFIESLETIELAVVGPGGKQMTVVAFILEDSLTHSVETPGAYDFKAVSGFAQFE